MEDVRRRRDGRAERAAALRPRQRRPEEDGAGGDAVFPYLTTGQAAVLRELVVRCFAEAGHEVAVLGDLAELSDGRTFALGALAGRCLDAGRGQDDDPDPGAAFAPLVREHVARVLAVDAAPAARDLPVADVLARVHVRVVGRGTLPDRARRRLAYARHLAGDLVEVLATDDGPGGGPGEGPGDGAGAVRLLDDEDVAVHGWGQLRAAGLQNLLRVAARTLREPGTRAVVENPHGVAVHTLTGASPFVASTLMVLPAVLHRTTGAADHPDGVLLAVPHRHQLAVVPVDASTLLASLEVLVPFAARAFETGVGPVSPFVFWWRDGDLTQVSALTERGTWAVDDTGPFGDLLQRLLDW